jgi:hypothetical protein
VRAVYQPDGGDPEELAIHDVEDAESSVIAQFLTTPSNNLHLITYAADGSELTRLN